jgi:hypothetical protein
VTLRCSHCGCDRLFGPAVIIGPDGAEYTYWDCQRCHTLLLEVGGQLEARAGAW